MSKNSLNDTDGDKSMGDMNDMTRYSEWKALGSEVRGELIREFHQKGHCKTGSEIEARMWMSNRTGIPIEGIPGFERR